MPTTGHSYRINYLLILEEGVEPGEEDYKGFLMLEGLYHNCTRTAVFVSKNGVDLSSGSSHLA
eukprot:scaffold2593_cov170-Amphora_coffeaeformis.AAC.4